MVFYFRPVHKLLTLLGAVMRESVKVLMDCVNEFYLSMRWIRKDCVTDWKTVARLLGELKTFEDAVEACEAIDTTIFGYKWFAIATSPKDSFGLYYEKGDEIPNPLERCQFKLKSTIQKYFWLKTTILHLENDDEIMAKIEIVKFIDSLPEPALVVIRESKPVGDVPLADFTLNYLGGNKKAA